jgi:hypothetical protein
MKYAREADALWKTAVPSHGQAKTVQGELLRAVEKLRDESMRNGNINWENGYEILLGFLRKTLLDSSSLSEKARATLTRDLARVANYEYPCTSDELFDRIADCVMEWCLAHPTPVPHVRNRRLRL